MKFNREVLKLYTVFTFFPQVLHVYDLFYIIYCEPIIFHEGVTFYFESFAD